MTKQEKIKECQCAECLLKRLLARGIAKKFDSEMMELPNDNKE